MINLRRTILEFNVYLRTLIVLKLLKVAGARKGDNLAKRVVGLNRERERETDNWLDNPDGGCQSASALFG